MIQSISGLLSLIKRSGLMTFAVCVGAIFLSNFAWAGLITPAGISAGGGTYYHDKALIIDGLFPAEGSVWTGSQCVYWYGTGPWFTIDLGNSYWVEDIVVQVDNNDNYKVDYSTDGSSWTNLLYISSGYGEIGWGMDTMSTISGDPEYISQLDFSAKVEARYLKIYATGGDNMYSVSELQAYGTPVPLPGALWLLGSGFIGLLGLGRRFVKI